MGMAKRRCSNQDAGLKWAGYFKFGPACALNLFHGRNPADFSRQFGRSHFPSDAAKPSFEVTGCRDEVVLEFGLGQSAIASPPQTMSPHQFTLGSLNCVAVFHPLFELLGLLFLPAPL